MDGLIESLGRTLARRTSRRGFLGVIGKALFGAAVFPLLPVNRVLASASLNWPPVARTIR